MDTDAGACQGGRGERAADVTVLTIDALQVAVGEKDVANAALAADGRLFAAVDADGGSFGLCSGVAETEGGDTVCGTSAWTIVAIHDAKIHFFRGKKHCFRKKMYFCIVFHPGL